MKSETRKKCLAVFLVAVLASSVIRTESAEYWGISTYRVYAEDETGVVSNTADTVDETKNKPCKITFEPNLGKCSITAKEVLSGSTPENLPEAKRDGYRFLGWFTKKEGGTKVSADTVITQDIRLFAQWSDSMFDGKGTAEAPYRISSVSDLFMLSELINDKDTNTKYSSCYYVQTSDIDLENKEFTPIGVYLDKDGKYESNKTFKGVYNGNYHKIINLNIDHNQNYCGLFGRIGNAQNECGIKNLSVYGKVKNTGYATGGIAGESALNAYIQNCSFSGTVSSENIRAGAIAGMSWSGSTISSCYANAEVSCTKQAGGIIGAAIVGSGKDSKDFVMKNCYFSGKVTAEESDGICGYKEIGTEAANSIVFIDTYYLKEACDNRSPDKGCTALSMSLLADSEQLLGSPFTHNNEKEKINDGLPLFEWQVTPYKFEGEGSKESPYLIRNKDELIIMRDLVNTPYFKFNDKCYKLTSDIDLENKKWIPIGKGMKDGVQGKLPYFCGRFDGCGHCVKNISVSESDKFAGFFGASASNSIIENLVVTGNVEGVYAVGGVAGEINGASVKNCAFIGNVKAQTQAGGVTGLLWNYASVDSCYHNGSVTATDESGVSGGITGVAYVDNGDVAISNSYHVGEVKGSENESGSVVGRAGYRENTENKLIINNCLCVKGDCRAMYGSSVKTNGVIELTSSLLKKSADDLGEPFADNSTEKNNGYPVFKWELEDKKTDEPENSRTDLSDPENPQADPSELSDTEKTDYVIGDVDNDGELTLKDIYMIRRHIVDIETPGAEIMRADIDCDGEITVKYVSLLRTVLVGGDISEKLNNLLKERKKQDESEKNDSKTPSEPESDISVNEIKYGKSERGRDLTAYEISTPEYSRTILMNFAIHGFEDDYDADGQVLVDTANYLKEYYSDAENLKDCRLIIIPCANPDGLLDGNTNNGFGRCNANGVDLNRDFDVNYKPNTESRFFTEKAFSASESRALRDLCLESAPDIVIDFHGWYNCTIGDFEVAEVFRSELGLPFQNGYNSENGNGYFSNWAHRQGYEGLLVEFSNTDINYEKLINAVNRLISGEYDNNTGEYTENKSFSEFKSFKAYTLSDEHVETYQAFDEPFATTSYIDGSVDECTVQKIYENGWVRVEYPVSSGYKVGFCKLSDFISDDTAVEHYKAKVNKNCKVFIKPYSNQSIGEVWDTDEITVVASYKNMLQIIYPLDNGGYKMGWIYSDIHRI